MNDTRSSTQRIKTHHPLWSEGSFVRRAGLWWSRVMVVLFIVNPVFVVRAAESDGSTSALDEDVQETMSVSSGEVTLPAAETALSPESAGGAVADPQVSSDGETSEETSPDKGTDWEATEAAARTEPAADTSVPPNDEPSQTPSSDALSEAFGEAAAESHISADIATSGAVSADEGTVEDALVTESDELTATDGNGVEAGGAEHGAATSTASDADSAVQQSDNTFGVTAPDETSSSVAGAATTTSAEPTATTTGETVGGVLVEDTDGEATATESAARNDTVASGEESAATSSENMLLGAATSTASDVDSAVQESGDAFDAAAPDETSSSGAGLAATTSAEQSAATTSPDHSVAVGTVGVTATTTEETAATSTRQTGENDEYGNTPATSTVPVSSGTGGTGTTTVSHGAEEDAVSAATTSGSVSPVTRRTSFGSGGGAALAYIQKLEERLDLTATDTPISPTATDTLLAASSTGEAVPDTGTVDTNIDASAMRQQPVSTSTRAADREVERNDAEPIEGYRCTEVSVGEIYCVRAEDGLSAASDTAAGARVFSERVGGGDLEIIYQSADGDRVQVTDNNYDDDRPMYDAASGYIVWHALVNDRYQIFSYNTITGETHRLTNTDYNNSNPSIYNGLVVWQGWVDDNWEIFTAHVGGDGDVRRVTRNTWNDMFPKTYRDVVSWQGYEGGVWGVYLYTPATGEVVRLSDGHGSFENPRFALLYENRADNGDVEMVGYDLDTRTAIPLGSSSGGGDKKDGMPKPAPTDNSAPVPGASTSINAKNSKTKTGRDDGDGSGTETEGGGDNSFDDGMVKTDHAATATPLAAEVGTTSVRAVPPTTAGTTTPDDSASGGTSLDLRPAAEVATSTIALSDDSTVAGDSDTPHVSAGTGALETRHATPTPATLDLRASGTSPQAAKSVSAIETASIGASTSTLDDGSVQTEHSAIDLSIPPSAATNTLDLSAGASTTVRER